LTFVFVAVIFVSLNNWWIPSNYRFAISSIIWKSKFNCYVQRFSSFVLLLPRRFVSKNCCQWSHFRDVQLRSWESWPFRLDSPVICMSARELVLKCT